MSGFVEDFYYGNIEPQECCSELKNELKKKLRILTEKEEELNSKLSGEEKLCSQLTQIHITIF